MCEPWQFHCTSQWGQQTLWSEHLYCVAIAFKMTEWVEQWICIKFCVKLEHSSVETIRMIQKAATMGNWWFILITRPLMHHIAGRVFSETSNHPGDSAPSIAQIWQHATSDFSQNWNYLWKGRDFRPWMRFRKIRQDSRWWLGELCEALRCLLWRGLRHHCPMYNVSCISPVNVSIFCSAWLDTFWTDLTCLCLCFIYCICVHVCQ